MTGNLLRGPARETPQPPEPTRSQRAAAAIVGALSAAGTRLLFGLPGGDRLAQAGGHLAVRAVLGRPFRHGARRGKDGF